MKKNAINYDLEILRGFAGLLVVFSHLFNSNLRSYFDKGYFHPNMGLLSAPSHMAVLIFFVLSGYVIGVTNQKQLTADGIGLYIEKRLVRIYPIYLIAIILGLIATPDKVDLATILSNLTFTQNLHFEVIWSVGPAWSLNYEIIFYALFIPLSYYKIDAWLAFIVCMLVGTFSLYLPINPIVTSYSYGFSFWLLGLIIARNFSLEQIKLKILPLLLYVWGVGDLLTKNVQFNISSFADKIKPVLDKSHYIWAQRMVTLDDLLIMPYCFMVVLLFAKKTFSLKTAIFLGLQIVPAFLLYSHIKHSQKIDNSFLLDAVFLSLAIILYFVNISENWLRKPGIYLGSISYGIYIIHYPILILFGRFYKSQQFILGYSVKLTLYFVIVFIAAWILEKRLQPLVRNWFFK